MLKLQTPYGVGLTVAYLDGAPLFTLAQNGGRPATHLQHPWLSSVAPRKLLHTQDQNSIHIAGRGKRPGWHEHAGFMVGVLFRFFSVRLLKTRVELQPQPASGLHPPSWRQVLPDLFLVSIPTQLWPLPDCQPEPLPRRAAQISCR